MNRAVPQNAPSALPVPNTPAAWLIEVLRLARWNLYLVWRRIMSKVLIILLIVCYAIVIGFVGLILHQIVNAPPPATPVFQCPPDATGCVTPSPEEQKQIEQQQAQERAQSLSQFSDPVTFPTSLGFAATITRIIGLVLICVMAGTLVGSEYGFSTQRLALSRGVSRLQTLVAQALALAVISMIVAAGMLVLSSLVGLTLGPAFGRAISAPSFGGWVEILWFFIALSFSLFAYTLMAQAAATLGKSTVAGVGLALGWIVIEVIVGGVLTAIGLILSNTGHADLGAPIQHIQDWFLGTNVGALVSHAGQYPIGLAPAPSADQTFVKVFIIALVYCAVFFGGSYLLLSRRDVTE